MSQAIHMTRAVQPADRVHRPLLLNPAFVLLWAAYGISAMGDHISELAVLRWMGALDSPNITQLQAQMTFMFMLPFFLFGPFNGILADRLPRRGIMIAADFIRAVVMLNFVFLLSRFTPLGGIWAFMPLLIVGCFAAMFSPARLSFMPTLIGENQLMRANAMTAGLGVVATMMSAVIGGWLAREYKPQFAFNVDAATFCLSGVLLLMIMPGKRAPQRRHVTAGPRALKQAFSYAWTHRRVCELIGVALIVWSCGAVVRSIMPALVRDVYQRPDFFQIGIFQAYLGVGILLGALLLSLFGNALRSEIVISWSLLGVSLAVLLLACTALFPIPLTLAYVCGVAGVILAGVFSSGLMASYNALLQRIVPNRLRGRIFGLTDLVSMGGLLLGTGLLALPSWPNIDDWIGWILLSISAVIAGAAAISFATRFARSPFSWRIAFWWNVTEFYCRLFFRLQRVGPCTIPGEGPVIVVSNHTCSIDPLLLIASSPRRLISFLIAEEYSKIPLGNRFIRMIGCVPIRRDSQDAVGTRAAIRHLRKDKVLGVFLEGGIPAVGERRQPKHGAVMLALHTKALIVPVHISGTRHDQRVAASFFRRQRARVRFGQPIDLSRYWIPTGDRAAVARASEKLMDRIHALSPDRDDESQETTEPGEQDSWI
jgi:1-acyl-sn-glycerol-3-phosphate acyltransferase